MRLNQFIRTKGERGDTIVEVLIAITIVSLVLAGAYASTNHNVRATQDTQEHGQALQLVQTQVEFLRAAKAAGSPIPSAPPPPPFAIKNCFVSTGANAGKPASASADCVVTGSGTVCNAEPCFTLAITNSGSAYNISAKWASLLGGTANVSIDYLLP